MGLLDDAIREHLELKRRSGADPTEIERLEREALGPVGRPAREAPDLLSIGDHGPAGAEPEIEDAGGWEEPVEHDAPFDQASDFDVVPPELEALPEDDHHSTEELGPVPSFTEEPASVSEQEYEEATPGPDRDHSAPRHHEIAEEWKAHQRSSSADPVPVESDTQKPDSPPPAPAIAPLGEERHPSRQEDELDLLEQETVEYDVESGEAPVSEDEDVLEETPDFLQDAPDHDRLWFEQRPPRDFDIDG